MEVDPTNGDIIKVLDDGVDSDELDDLLDWDENSDIVKSISESDGEGVISLYYFGDEETDGAMKTGATTVTLDGESYNFLFNKTGGVESKGRGLTGVDDNKYIYSFGCRIKAGSDDKYQVVAVSSHNGTPATDIHAELVIVEKIDSTVLKNAYNADTFTNDKDETVSYTDISELPSYLKELLDADEVKLYLVNTSGNVQKSKVAAKDGDDWYFYVKNRAVKLYTNNKNLDDRDTDTTEKWENYVKYPDVAN